jgi:DNA replication protein DnaC
MTQAKQKAAVGERLPYLLSKLKAPPVLERLEQTAAKARDESWPYEQFLEVLLEAEVFARDASGAPTRVRAAQFPQRKDARRLRPAGAAGRLAAARQAPGPACLDRGARQRLLLRPKIDRLVHHATMVTLKGKSYRLRERGSGVVPAAQAPRLRLSRAK